MNIADLCYIGIVGCLLVLAALVADVGDAAMERAKEIP
jgi:hypothetical protein